MAVADADTRIESPGSMGDTRDVLEDVRYSQGRSAPRIRRLGMTPRWHTVYGDDWFDVADYSDNGNFSVWMNGAKLPRYGWLRSEVVGVLGGWALLLLAGYGFLWNSRQRHLPLAIIYGIIMFVGAVVSLVNGSGKRMRQAGAGTVSLLARSPNILIERGKAHSSHG